MLLQLEDECRVHVARFCSWRIFELPLQVDQLENVGTMNTLGAIDDLYILNGNSAKRSIFPTALSKGRKKKYFSSWTSVNWPDERFVRNAGRRVDAITYDQLNG
jgi:hypothetical protein